MNKTYQLPINVQETQVPALAATLADLLEGLRSASSSQDRVLVQLPVDCALLIYDIVIGSLHGAHKDPTLPLEEKIERATKIATEHDGPDGVEDIRKFGIIGTELQRVLEMAGVQPDLPAATV